MEPDLRPASDDDRAAISSLLQAAELAEYGRITADWDEIVGLIWRAPAFSPADDARIVVLDGTPVGFVGVFPPDDEPSTGAPAEPYGAMVGLETQVREASEALEASLIDWATDRASARRAVGVRHYVPREDARRQALLRERGFERVRSMWTMHRDLPDHEPAPPPVGIAVVTLEEHPDHAALHAADQEAFGEHFGFAAETFEGWRARRIDVDRHDPTQWFLALDGDQVAGFLFQVTGGLVPQIAELGVRRPWRGRGIGTALLRHSFADIARRGGCEVTLWVDSENATGAVGLYRRVGMRAIVVTDVFQTDLG